MSTELLNMRYDEARERYVRPYCASCLMTIRGSAVEVEGGGLLHVEPGCLIKWGGMSTDVREKRAEVSLAFAAGEGWLEEPTAPGNYWMRLKGCDFVRSVSVLYVDGSPVVNCQGRMQSRDECLNYQFKKSF